MGGIFTVIKTVCSFYKEAKATAAATRAKTDPLILREEAPLLSLPGMTPALAAPTGTAAPVEDEAAEVDRTVAKVALTVVAPVAAEAAAEALDDADETADEGRRDAGRQEVSLLAPTVRAPVQASSSVESPRENMTLVPAGSATFQVMDLPL